MSWISEEYRKLERSPRALRRFGFTVGAVILLLGTAFLWRQRGAGWPLVSIGAVLVFAAGLAPLSLKWVHACWMIVALALGWIVTRILLTIVFVFVVTPLGLLQRFVGKCAIEFAFKTGAASYWRARTTQSLPKDYQKQF
jgi:hypothetical protein